MTDIAVETVGARTAATSTRAGAAARLDSIDIMRGLVIVLMVLDHVRDYFHAAAFNADPLDVATSSPWLYATRWITHFCAPTFVFLAGVSALLQLERGKSKIELSRFLLTRGLWLILLELTVVNVAWNFGLGPPILQVIWVIGASMIVLAGLVFLPAWSVLALGALIIVGHNAFDPVVPAQLGASARVWTLLHEGGPIALGPLPAFAAYPLVPWIGIMCLGYGSGRLFLQESRARTRSFLALGAGMIVAFLLLRWGNVYGDPSAWAPQDEAWKSVGSFMNVQKYPPSLQYVLATLGPMFLLTPVFDRLKGPVAEFFLTYGRVPLFAYVLHIFLAHALAQAVSSAMGYPVWGIMTLFTTPDVLKGWGFDLPTVYAVWALVLLLLFPLCRWFGRVKRTRRDWWLSYL